MPAYRKLRGFLLSAQRRRDAKKKLLAAWRESTLFILAKQERRKEIREALCGLATLRE
jgi:hypothetical protein